MTVYRWRAHAGVPVPAQVAGEALETIRVRNNGRLTQEAVVKAARPSSSPLHPAFDWNDKSAAHKWRLSQAQYIIRKLDVVEEKPGGDRQAVRAFVNISMEEDRSYTSIAHAMSDDEIREQVIARAWKELQDWKDRYDEIVEFAAVFDAIRSIERKDDAA